MIDSKIYPLDLDIILRVVKYEKPDNNIYKVKIFENDKEPTLQEVDEAYCDEKYEGDYMVVQMYKSKDTHLSFLDEEMFKCNDKVELQFSVDGKYLAMCIRDAKNPVINIFKVQTGSPITLLKDIS